MNGLYIICVMYVCVCVIYIMLWYQIESQLLKDKKDKK